MAALEALPVVLGSTLNVSTVFERVAETVRPAMDLVQISGSTGRNPSSSADSTPSAVSKCAARSPTTAPTPRV